MVRNMYSVVVLVLLLSITPTVARLVVGSGSKTGARPVKEGGELVETLFSLPLLTLVFVCSDLRRGGIVLLALWASIGISMASVLECWEILPFYLAWSIVSTLYLIFQREVQGYLARFSCIVAKLAFLLLLSCPIFSAFAYCALRSEELEGADALLIALFVGGNAALLLFPVPPMVQTVVIAGELAGFSVAYLVECVIGNERGESLRLTAHG